MDIDLLKAFCELASRGNYRIAADKLCITQPALTKKIQRLEDAIETKLFHRGRSGAALTQVGVTLLPEAKRLVSNFDAFQNLSRHIVAGKTGLLKIGFGISSYQVATDAIANFKNDYPSVYISLEDIPSHKQLDMIRSGELQLSFRRLPVPDAFDSVMITEDELVLAVHSSVPINKDDPLDSVRNMHYMRLNPKRGPGVEQMVNKYLLNTGRDLIVTQDANDILTLVTMISANLGYSLIPKSTIYIGNGQIQYIALSDSVTKWSVGLVWNRAICSPVRETFIQHMMTLSKKAN